MSALFPILLLLAMAAVLGSLFGGLFFMARGRPEDAVRSNLMMRWRVVLQGSGLILFALAFLTR